MERKNIERIQRRATAWILGRRETKYKELSKLKLLALTFYFELHDLLMLLDLMKGSFNIKLPIKPNATNARQRELTAIDKSRTKKAD